MSSKDQASAVSATGEELLVQVEGLEPFTYKPDEQFILPVLPPGWLWQKLESVSSDSKAVRYVVYKDKSVFEHAHVPWWIPPVRGDNEGREVVMLDPRLWIEATRLLQELKLASLRRPGQRKEFIRMQRQTIKHMREQEARRIAIKKEEDAELEALRASRAELHRQQAEMWRTPIVHYLDVEKVKGD